MEFKPENIRNVMVVGHQGSGKTSLIESMAYINGLISAKGSIEKKNTLSDFLPKEKEKQTSLKSAIVPIERNGYRINLIDLPGNDDFIFETIGLTKLVKGAILVIDASKGVQNGTIKAFKLLKRRGIPMFIFLNKMDKEEVNFNNLFEEIKDKLDAKKCVPFSYPVGKEENFDGYINVVELKARKYNELKKICEDDIIYDDKKKIIFELHNRLCEDVAGINDELLEKFFSGEPLTKEEIKFGLREGVLKGELYPILVGSSLKNIGMNTLSEMLIDYLPSPTDLKPIEAKDKEEMPIEVKTTLDGNPSLQIFSNSYNSYQGVISTFKVQSGIIHLNDKLFCLNNNKEYKINSLFHVVGEKLIPVDEIGAGDLGATTRLEDIKLGYTLSSIDNPIEFDVPKYPTPIYYKAVVADTKKDSDKLFVSVQKLMLEDPTIGFKKDETTGQVLIGGLSKTHLLYVLSRLTEEYAIKFHEEPIKIAYRETITKASEAEGRYVKQTGGSGYYGVVQMRFEPAKETSFASEVFGGHIDKGYFPAVEKGFLEAMEKGSLIHAPVINVKATLLDGKQHSVDSNEMAFKSAAILAFRAAYDKANPIILEPYDKIEIHINDEFLGTILGDLSKRRGRILNTAESQTGYLKIQALVPEAELLEYANELKSMTKGTGFFNLEFDSYKQVPEALQRQIIEAYKE